MSNHKGGSGQVPFGGFHYSDHTGTVQSGTLTVIYESGAKNATVPFAVDQTTQQGYVTAGDIDPANPGSVVDVTFLALETTPAHQANSALDPQSAPPGEFVAHAFGATIPWPSPTDPVVNNLYFDQLQS